MKIVIAILASSFLANLFVWWAGARLLRKGEARRGFRIALHLFMAFQVGAELILIVGRIRDWNVDQLLPSPLMIATFIWHFALLLTAFVYLGLLLCEGALTLYRHLRRRAKSAAPAQAEPSNAPAHATSPSDATLLPPDSAPPSSSPDAPASGPLLSVSRRQFLTSAIAFTPPLVTIISSTIASRQIQNFRIREITVPLPQLPKALDGVTIAHVSDTHVGRFSNGKVLHRIAEATNELKADLVAVTGDIINDSLRWMPEAIDMLQRIDAPVYICEGNHDLIDDRFEFRMQMKALADRYLLVNEARTSLLRGIPVQILGLSWDGPDRKDETPRREFALSRTTADLMEKRNPELFPIMLAHHPHAWDYTPEIPITLSGHTHGGQLMLNEELGFGPAMFRYWTGLYTRPASERSPHSSLVVSNGAGNWFPLRVAAPAEIVHITLRKA